MKFQYSFRHMESSEALKYDFERKMANGMEPLIQTSSPIAVTFIVENNQHKVHVELHARNHVLIEITEVSDEMHKTIDLAVDTLYKKLTREKSRQVKHGGRVDRFEAARSASPQTDTDDDMLDESYEDSSVR
jgi:ribosomal subunit interface protein